MRSVVNVTIEFDRYIAHPYWPERETVIKIMKDSGMARQKSDDKRETALMNQLKKEGISKEEFERIKAAANRQWYRVNNNDQTSEIVIPRHQIAGSLVQAVGTATKNLRGKYDKDSFRSMVEISDFRTSKTESDGKFDRYVKLEGSNMRSHQVNEYIQDFTAIGTFRVREDANLENLEHLLDTAVENIGVGASRKMGFGRGRVVLFAVEKAENKVA